MDGQPNAELPGHCGQSGSQMAAAGISSREGTLLYTVGCGILPRIPRQKCRDFSEDKTEEESVLWRQTY